MKRTAKAMAFAAALVSGCITTDNFDQASAPHAGPAGNARQVSNAVGPHGEPVGATANKNNGIQRVKAESSMNDPNVQQTWGGTRPPMPSQMAGAVAATGALVGGPPPNMGGGRSSVRFVGPNGMKVAWFNGQGPNGFTPTMVETPGRYNFPQGAVYRLKLSDLPNRPGVELYPTLEVIPANCKSGVFLAHSAVPVGITEEDMEQVAAGNFIVKVIYLPDPAYQDLAASGPDEIVSSRLEPGVDPVAEATRRGTVLLILRIGNIDLEAPNSPRLDSPAGGMQHGGHAAGAPVMLPPNAKMAQR